MSEYLFYHVKVYYPDGGVASYEFPQPPAYSWLADKIGTLVPNMVAERIKIGGESFILYRDPKSVGPVNDSLQPAVKNKFRGVIVLQPVLRSPKKESR